jgi:hypothetical protein
MEHRNQPGMFEQSQDEKRKGQPRIRLFLATVTDQVHPLAIRFLLHFSSAIRGFMGFFLPFSKNPGSLKARP